MPKRRPRSSPDPDVLHIRPGPWRQQEIRLNAEFPQRTDRMVLEGNVDPNDVWSRETQLWNEGMNQRFTDAARVAAADNAQLGLGGTVAQVTSARVLTVKMAPRYGMNPPTNTSAASGPASGTPNIDRKM